MMRYSPSAVQLSVLDRLMDQRNEDERSQRRSFPSRADFLKTLRESVARDIEWLLNQTRREGLPDELQNSLYGYGLPDLSTFYIPRDTQRLCELIRTTVERFEPRIERGCRVSLVSSNNARQTLTFLIEGNLLVEPAPEPIRISTEIYLTTGQNENAEGHRAG